MVARRSSKPFGVGSSPTESAKYYKYMCEYITESLVIIVDTNLENLSKDQQLEKRIVILRSEGLSYREIQIKLGNPSKQFIRDTLKKLNPELLGDIFPNHGKL